MKYIKTASLLSVTLLASCATTGADTTTNKATDTAPEQAAAVSEDARILAFFDRLDQENLAASPFSKSYRGIRDEDYGRWDDPSDAAAEADFKRGQDALAEMKREFDPADLNADNRLSYRLFEYQMNRAARAFRFRDNGYIFDQMNGAQAQLPAFLINIHSVTTKQHAADYVSRLYGMGPFIEQLVQISAKRADNGVIVPDWVFPYVINDAKNVIAGSPFDNGKESPLFSDLKKKVNALDIPASEKADLIARGEEAMVDSIKPAYEKLITEMQRQQAGARDGDGVWRFKDGDDYYNERLSNYTTTDLTADQIHQIGLDNVARIHGEMREIMAKVGFEGSLQEFFTYLRTEDRFFYETREAYLADANAKIEGMTARVPEFFNTLPKAPLRVKPVEAFREKSAGKAFYNGPAPDGSRPGTYYVNLYRLRDMSKTELEALAYHEALPGHHLQRTIQTELGDLPAFRRFGGVTAYTEGWGLYSEELGKDMGFYEDPYSDFGRLGMELWRACRLVVDTGIHDKRWSREKAIAYLTENTPNPDGDIRKAIERYTVYPGQATAYMIGKLKIMEVRSRAQRELGDDFSYGDFHDVILRSGPVPLTIMEERVDTWIAESK